MDPVHGFIVVDEPWLLELIDTPEFQRLRRIRQLGVSSGTYHGAEHSRFGHSLGAFSIMKRVLPHLTAVAPLEALDRKAALAAALLHDVGHGPFSHALENLLTPGISHEAWSEAVVTGRTQVAGVLRRVHPQLPSVVAQLIRGRHPIPWLGQLVASQLDVDRFDYLLRDSLYTGAGYGRFDLERIIHTMTVSGDRLALEIKGLHAAEEYVLARHFMYWRVYLHKTIRAQELMLRTVVGRAKTLWEAGEDVPLPPGLAALWQLAKEEEPVSDDGSLAEAVPGEPGPAPEGSASPAAGSPVSPRRLEAYLSLDDTDLWQALKMWRQSLDPILADMSRRILDRDLLKPLFRHAMNGVHPQLHETARRLVAEEGRDPDHYCLVDGAWGTPYEALYGRNPGVAAAVEGKPAGAGPRGDIWIVKPDGTGASLSELSPLIRALQDRPREAVNLYLPESVRNRLRDLFL